MEVDAVRGLHIFLGVALAEVAEGAAAETAAHAAAHLGGERAELAAQNLPENDHEDNRDDPVVEEFLHGRLHVDDVGAEVRASIVEPLGEVGVCHDAGLIDGTLPLFRKDNLVGVNLDLIDFLLRGQVHEDIVGNFFDPCILQLRNNDRIQNQGDQKNHKVQIGNQRCGLFGILVLLHGFSFALICYIVCSTSVQDKQEMV